MHKIFMVGLAVSLVVSCRKHNDHTALPYTSDFSKNTDGWQAFFSDYHAGREEDYELSFQHAMVPEPLDNGLKALRISGNNHSDDLLSMVYRKFDGLIPNKTYSIYIEVELASNVPSNWFGVGGSPNLSLGAGAIAEVPANTVDEEGLYRPNFSSEIQSHASNETFKVLGTIGVGEDATQYALITRDNNDMPLVTTSNEQGELWVLIGTDSGFEGETTLYYKSIKVNVK